MTSRYALPLDRLEQQAHVQAADQLSLQAEPRQHAPLMDGPAVHPFGDGATGADGDGE